MSEIREILSQIAFWGMFISVSSGVGWWWGAYRDRRKRISDAVTAKLLEGTEQEMHEFGFEDFTTRTYMSIHGKKMVESVFTKAPLVALIKKKKGVFVGGIPITGNIQFGKGTGSGVKTSASRFKSLIPDILGKRKRRKEGVKSNA